MNALRLIPLIALFCLPIPARSTTQMEADFGGFVHQITLRRDTEVTRIRQWVSPLQIRLPLAGGALDIQTALMYVAQSGASPEEIWGPLNTRFAGTWELGRRALFSLHASLPTGKQALDAPSAELLRTLARNDLNFPVRTFGDGLDVGAGLSLARQSGRLGLSLGAAYTRKGAYHPIEGAANYKPGDEATLTVGLDYTWKRLVYRLSAVGAHHLTDQVDGLAVFQNGKQILLQAGVYHEGRKLQLQAEIVEIVRMKNRLLDNSHFLYEFRDSNGNDLRVHLKADWSPIRVLALFAEANLKHITANAYPTDSPLYQGRARIWGGGGGMAITLGKIRVALRATQQEGSAVDRTVQFSTRNYRGALTLAF